MPLRNYKNAPSHTIPGGVANSSTTSIVVDSVVGWPTSFPFTCIIEPDTALEEIVDVTNVVGTTLTVTRGADGSTASAHAAGSKIAHGYTARDATEANQHINATSGIHGSTGSLVDTGSTQTIAGAKTFSATSQHNGLLNAAAGGTLNGSFTFGSPPIVDGASLRNLTPTKQIFTTNGTWNKPAGLKYAIVEVVGGGGAGAGATTTAAGQWSVGDGGGGGEYRRGLFAAGALSASHAVTVGAGGAGSSGAAGAAGGNSSFGALITANSGGAGAIRTANTLPFTGTPASRAGGTGGSGGDVASAGGAGGSGIGIVSTAGGQRGGDGGASALSGSVPGTATVTGPNGLTPGGGGGGTAQPASAGAALAGGNGANGIVIVWEFY